MTTIEELRNLARQTGQRNLGTTEGSQPNMIVELPATPAKDTNVLVEILGRNLNDGNASPCSVSRVEDEDGWQPTPSNGVFFGPSLPG